MEEVKQLFTVYEYIIDNMANIAEKDRKPAFGRNNSLGTEYQPLNREPVLWSLLNTSVWVENQREQVIG